MGEALPRALAGEYQQLSCKKVGERGAALLCQQIATGRQVLVKVTAFPVEGQCLKNEYDILRRLERAQAPAAARFPRAVDFYAAEGEYALVREYIPGQSMEDYVESEPARPGIRREMAVDCAISVLEQLLALHRLSPPVIHRDIKPQNVILDEDGGFHLIDLGIARTPREGDDADTQIMGTRLTAPPEQYGYRQTDERSDIYSVGVLLRYCLTGEYAERADEAIDADLRAIVRRATQFDPQMRYPRAEDMLYDLRGAAPAPARPRRRGRKIALLALALALCCCAALWIAQLNRPYVFREPLIEQAVRRALNQPEGPLTARALAQVKSLHIFGGLVYDDDSQFYFLGDYVFPYDPELREDERWEESGGIASLADLAALPNLEELCLYRQDIRDLTPLRKTKLRGLGIGYNPVDDLSPLAGNASLEYLNVSGLALDDAGAIATLPHLKALCLAGTGIQSLDALGELPLEELNAVDIPLDNPTLSALAGLKRLTVSKLRPELLEVLTQLPLEELTVTHAQEVSPRALEALPHLTALSYRTEEAQALTADPLHFPALKTLELKGVALDSLSCLSQLTNLETLAIYEAPCADYDGLDALPHLKTILATPDQAEALEEMYPGHGWVVK